MPPTRQKRGAGMRIATIEQIEEILGIPQSRFRRWLQQNGKHAILESVALDNMSIPIELLPGYRKEWEDEYLPISEISREVSVPYSTIYVWARAGWVRTRQSKQPGGRRNITMVNKADTTALADLLHKMGTLKGIIQPDGTITIPDSLL